MDADGGDNRATAVYDLIELFEPVFECGEDYRNLTVWVTANRRPVSRRRRC